MSCLFDSTIFFIFFSFVLAFFYSTRIHVYEFEARTLSSRNEIKDAVSGRRLSFPTTDTRWTNRKKPGLDVFAYVQDPTEMRHQVSFYLQPLLQFAKDVLHAKNASWEQYPIYLKATGGLRTLPAPYRLKLIAQVRTLFQDTTFNPFLFHEEHARVISGEEEAIYGWTAVNFVQGTLLRNSEGTGSVLNPGLTYGVLEVRKKQKKEERFWR
jgi:Golgi nucleoside diphosphatase